MDEELIDQKLPYGYKEFKNIFSKAASDILLLHRPYNHKIKIKSDKENTLGLALFVSNLLPNYKPLNSTLLKTYIRDLLSQVKPLLLYLFSLPKSQTKNYVFILTTIN
jgi:hypothetical protein